MEREASRSWIPSPLPGRWSAHGELPVQAAHRAVADVDVKAARFDGELSLVVVEAEFRGPQRERNLLRLAGPQRHPLESVEPAHRLQDAGHLVVDVELHDVVARPGAGVEI